MERPKTKKKSAAKTSRKARKRSSISSRIEVSARTTPALSAPIASGDRSDFVAFAGLYVLATATLGVILMKESKRLGRRLFPPRLA